MGISNPLTDAQVAAKATAGYGYTPVSPTTLSTQIATRIPTDMGAGFPVGFIWIGMAYCPTPTASGATASGSSITLQDAGGASLGWSLPGTWRNIGPIGTGITNSFQAWQRIA